MKQKKRITAADSCLICWFSPCLAERRRAPPHLADPGSERARGNRTERFPLKHVDMWWLVAHAVKPDLTTRNTPTLSLDAVCGRICSRIHFRLLWWTPESKRRGNHSLFMRTMKKHRESASHKLFLERRRTGGQNLTLLLENWTGFFCHENT